MAGWTLKIYHVSSTRNSETGRVEQTTRLDPSRLQIPPVPHEQLREHIRGVLKDRKLSLRSVSVSATEQNTVIVYVNATPAISAGEQKGWIYKKPPTPPRP